MLAHTVHNSYGSVLSSDTRGLGCDSHGIYECLWMIFPDVSKKIADVATDVDGWCLDSSNDLNLVKSRPYQRIAALTCGITSNHVSTSTLENPFAMA